MGQRSSQKVSVVGSCSINYVGTTAPKFSAIAAGYSIKLQKLRTVGAQRSWVTRGVPFGSPEVEEKVRGAQRSWVTR